MAGWQEFLNTLATSIAGILLVLGAGAALDAERTGPLLARLGWLFPLRGKWLQRALAGLLGAVGIGLIVYSFPALIAATLLLIFVVIAWSPLALAGTIVWSAWIAIKGSSESCVSSDSTEVRTSRWWKVPIGLLLAGAGVALIALYGWFFLYLIVGLLIGGA